MAAEPSTSFSEVTLEALRQGQRAFAQERAWEQFHSPRNLALALVGEVGEVCELLQWRSDAGAPPGLSNWSAEEREHLAEELSDVLLYLVRMADVCNLDLGAAVLAKMRKNAAKYPAERCRGSSQKYTAYASSGAGGCKRQQR